MKNLKSFSLLSALIFFSSFSVYSSDKVTVVMDAPIRIQLKPDLTWSNNYNIGYYNVMGIDNQEVIDAPTYKPVVHVIDDMKEHSHHIRSIVKSICPISTIQEIEFMNPAEQIKESGLNQNADILNLSFGPGYLDSFNYKRMIDDSTKVLNRVIQDVIKFDKFNGVVESLKESVDKLIDSQIQYFSWLESGYLPSLGLLLSPEDLLKDIVRNLRANPQFPSEYTNSIESVIHGLDKAELKHNALYCKVYSSIAQAAKAGKIIVVAYGNHHNIITIDMEAKYTKRLNDLAREINENPETKGRLIIVGNSQYKKNQECLYMSSTRSISREPYVLTAPGTDITALVSDTKYDTMTGTSMAAPAVVGVLARLLGEYKKKYEEVGISDASAIRGIIADHVIHNARKTNIVTGEPLMFGFGQGVVNYTMAKEVIEEDLKIIPYLNILKLKAEAAIFMRALDNELMARQERSKMREDVHSLRLRNIDDSYKIQTLAIQKSAENYKNDMIEELFGFEEMKSVLISIYVQLDMMLT